MRDRFTYTPDGHGINDSTILIMDKSSKSVAPPHFVIAETATSTYSYHLRRVGTEGVKLGGLAEQYRALCGARLGWDTRLPLTTWGQRSHLPEHYCVQCACEAKRLGVAGLDGRDRGCAARPLRLHPAHGSDNRLRPRRRPARP